MKREIRTIPISAITVVNSRSRNKQKFKTLVTSVDHLGLKRPITVNVRNRKTNYELVCGEGRIEAFRALGRAEIPAILIDVAADDSFLMGLVENLARRQPSAIEVFSEVSRLAKRGYKINEIAAKVDLSPSYVRAVCHLVKHGDRHLLEALDHELIPPTIALEIAKAESGEAQKLLLEAYAQRPHTSQEIAALRRLAERCHVKAVLKGDKARPRATTSSLVRAYRAETERQHLVAKKADLAHARLVFIAGALQKLLRERLFIRLLREEALHDIPHQLRREISKQDGSNAASAGLGRL
jgi:ParB family transcriptional regulator, chromosome partitioning protein